MLYYLCSSKKTGDSGSLEGVVRGIVSKMSEQGALTEETIGALWKEAAGARAAKHSRPVSFRRSSLVVNVDGSGWLYELTLKKKEIVKKMSGKIADITNSKKKVRDIHLRIGEI